jgi:hypothetical protein
MENGKLHAKIALKRKVHRVLGKPCTYKKEQKIQMGNVAKSYTRKGFLTYDEMRKYLVFYEEAVCQI